MEFQAFKMSRSVFVMVVVVIAIKLAHSIGFALRRFVEVLKPRSRLFVYRDPETQISFVRLLRF